MISVKALTFTVVLLGFISFNMIAQSEEGCTIAECHENLITPSNIHPAMEEGCTICHESSNSEHPSESGNDFSLSDSLPDLCFICHDNPSEAENIMSVHGALNQGKKCAACHSPHSSDFEFLLLQNSVKETCNQCHDISDQKGIYHTPVEDGMCTDCHNPHQSANSFLLLEETPSLCLSCHDDMVVNDDKVNLHPPFEEDCLNCHNPHVSSNKYVLEEEVPELCFTCHDDPEQDARVLSVHDVIKEKNKCISCHSPHSSKYSALTLEEEPGLCLSCHNRELKRDDKTVQNIEAKLSENNYIHPPVDDGCTDCHDAHASQYQKLLSERFPEGNYSYGISVEYELCFSCHDKSMIEVETTTEDTEFRDGDKNLHFLHVNREKSRSCINCHDVHGSPNEHLIAEEMPFGSIKMKLNYNTDGNSGSCLPGCHNEKSYKK